MDGTVIGVWVRVGLLSIHNAGNNGGRTIGIGRYIAIGKIAVIKPAETKQRVVIDVCEHEHKGGWESLRGKMRE